MRYRDDMEKLASMMYESFDPSMTADDTDFGMDDDFDIEVEFDVEGQDDMGVMNADPMGAVAPVQDDELTKILKADLKKLADFSQRLNGLVGQAEFEPWMVAKISKASDYAADVWFMLDATGADFANTGFEQAGPEQDLNF